MNSQTENAGETAAPTTGSDSPPFGVMAKAIARRPDLWSVALRSGLSMAGRGWWRKPPFLPVPDADWMRFRMTTAYGGDGSFGANSAFEADDLITWLEWRKEWQA